MNAEVPSPEVVEAPASLTPGAMIRVARERARLTLEEFASQTKLSKHTLEALERDDYAHLLEPVYVRGYYRKCAKVLNIPEEALISAYAARVQPRVPVPPAKLRLASGGDLGETRRLPLQLSVLAPIIAIVACVVLWRMFVRSEQQSLPPSVGVPLVPTPSQPATGSDPLSHLQPAGEGSAITQAPLPSTPPPVDAGASSPSAATPAPGSVAAPQPAAVAGATSLSLSFNAVSWARVEDSRGKSLLSGVISAGSQQVLDGVPPYSVFLGNAPGVKVQFGGQPLDISGYVKENSTARFTVPAAAQ